MKGKRLLIELRAFFGPMWSVVCDGRTVAIRTGNERALSERPSAVWGRVALTAEDLYARFDEMRRTRREIDSMTIEIMWDGERVAAAGMIHDRDGMALEYREDPVGERRVTQVSDRAPLVEAIALLLDGEREARDLVPFIDQALGGQGGTP